MEAFEDMPFRCPSLKRPSGHAFDVTQLDINNGRRNTWTVSSSSSGSTIDFKSPSVAESCAEFDFLTIGCTRQRNPPHRTMDTERHILGKIQSLNNEGGQKQRFHLLDDESATKKTKKRHRRKRSSKKVSIPHRSFDITDDDSLPEKMFINLVNAAALDEGSKALLILQTALGIEPAYYNLYLDSIDGTTISEIDLLRSYLLNIRICLGPSHPYAAQTLSLIERLWQKYQRAAALEENTIPVKG